MSNETNVIEYKCPCCGAGLQFRGDSQQLKCDYCDNSFDLETVRAFNDSEAQQTSEEFGWEQEPIAQWSDAEQQGLHMFVCPSCGGEILTEETTAASFCPYCDNPTILPGRLTGGLKPDAIIPFQTSREDAKEAFRKLCKGKPLLPGLFTQEQQIEKITGMYVPFWLYDCRGDFDGNYKATRIRTWSDSNYNYTKTEHFLLRRGAQADFQGIPMDGSSKMDDILMESIEPFDYSQIQDFDMAFLTGYLADKYDVGAEESMERANARVKESTERAFADTVNGYNTVSQESSSIQLSNGNAKYALYPVWLLNTTWNGNKYTFAMNGQTGKFVGDLPIDKSAAMKWFIALAAGIGAGLYALAWILHLTGIL